MSTTAGTSLANWAATFDFQPQEFHTPSQLDEIAAIVRSSARRNGKLRVFGARHSWNPLIATSQTSLSLERFSGIESVDGSAVWVKAGTTIHEVGNLLARLNLSLENQGDIDCQSLAGAISTGTHGTGIGFGPVASQVSGIKILHADGSHRTYTRDNPEWSALVISLGAHGVVTHYRINCVPMENYSMRSEKISWDEFVSTWDSRSYSTRNYEAFWFPNHDEVIAKITELSQDTRLQLPFNKSGVGARLENSAWWLLSEVSRLGPRGARFAAQTAHRLASDERCNGPIHRIFPTDRSVRFFETEYAFDFSVSSDLLRELKRWFQVEMPYVHFPLEIRSCAGDSQWLSPTQNRPTLFIAAHMYRKMEYRAYFKQLQAIFDQFGGRPHWGKMHDLEAKQINERYPRLSDFLKVRRKLDPNGLFLNPYLERLWGVTT